MTDDDTDRPPFERARYGAIALLSAAALIWVSADAMIGRGDIRTGLWLRDASGTVFVVELPLAEET